MPASAARPVVAYRNEWAVKGLKNLDPRVVYEELERIRDSNGGDLRPQDVVEAARDPASPLHRLPSWHWEDDAEAARRYRLSVARRLIRVVCVIPSPVEPPRQVYAHVRTAGVCAYKPVSVVANSTRETRAAVEELRRLALAMLKSLESLCSSLGVAQAQRLRRALASILAELGE